MPVLEALDVTLGILALAANQRRDMSAMAVVVVRMRGASVSGEVKEPIGTTAIEVAALLEPRVDHGDADLVALVGRVGETERRCQQAVDGSARLAGVLRDTVGGDDGVD